LHQHKRLLIPVRKYTPQPGIFRWPPNPRLCAFSPEDLLPLAQLANSLFSRIGIRARIGENYQGPAALRILRDPRITDPQAYRIAIAKDAITIFASTDTGAYYAIQTLRDMLALGGQHFRCCIIEDWPDFPRRGIYHDCSRGKVPKLETLMALVERLGHWKINELQLYIENTFTFIRHPAIGKGYSPFTPDELGTLQAHCDLHHIRLVGSLASLGHMEKILAIPEYTHLAELPGFRGWPGGTTLCPTDHGSIKLVGELYDEFVPLFKAEDFNACGDEPWELGQGRSKRAAGRISKGRVYLNYILKLHEICLKHGKRMNLWADIVLEHPELLPELPKDIVLLNWDYNAGGPRMKQTKDIASAGLPFMVCPGTSSWNTHGTRLANAIANVAEFAGAGLKYGAEGLLNTDWGDHGHRNLLGISLHGFAHGAAHSWNHRAVDDAKFTSIFCKHMFGPAGDKLAAPLKALGSTYLTCGAPYRNESALFYTLTEPLAGPFVGQPSRIDLMKPAGLHKVLSQLADPAIWPTASKGLDEFEALALREFRLAAAMDFTAAARALAAKSARAGHHIPHVILSRLTDELRAISDEFKTLWLARNKPSRLRDNLTLFKKAQTELLKLAKH
jgi:hexosaminidase